MKSKRKPYNDRAGYIASRKNPVTGDWAVIYNAKQAEIDADYRHVVVCEAHGNMIASASRDLAYADMKTPWEWCDDCRKASEPAPELESRRHPCGCSFGAHHFTVCAAAG